MLTASVVRPGGCPAGEEGWVYPASFDYHAPTALDEALSLLDSHGDTAKVMAGGQSLIPLMKLRFASPEVVVDINRIPGLGHIAEEGGGLRIGALVRHRDCERSDVLRGRFRLLGDAAPQISDPLVRNRGTVCGSLAHADPQGDWGAVMLALRAEVVVASSGGSRTLPIDNFFQGPFTTALEQNEIVTEVRVPDPGQRASGTYLKLERKVGDYATAAVAVQLSFSNGTVSQAGIALTGVGASNIRASAAEDALRGVEPTAEVIATAARLAAEAAQPSNDIRGTAQYKRNLVRIFTERGLRTAADAARAA
jgi:carbon-monoxide dehydrogenase medium subunit